MILEAYSSHHYVPINNFDEVFTESIGEQEVFSFIAGFTLQEEETNDVLATVRGIFFNEDKILNANEDIADLADMLDADVHGAMSALSRSKIHNQELNDEKAMLPLFSCYIQRIYVYPQYRGLGIAKYIFMNLEEIFLHCFNAPIHSLVIYPKPQQPDEKNCWYDSPDENGVMLKRMVSLLKKDGYKKIGATGYYAKNCAIDRTPHA
jgi:GNAT superfamily N-acetyltransferase